MDIDQVTMLVTEKCGQRAQHRDEAALGELVDAATHPDVGDYLRWCLPSETYLASDVRMLSWSAICREMGEASAPGSFIRPFGYLIIATSVGGNAICVHQTTGNVFWVDHDSFSDDMIIFRDRTTGDWQYFYEYSDVNVQRAMVPIAEAFDRFLISLLTDKLAAQLDVLD